jgi:hypothetical protein
MLGLAAVEPAVAVVVEGIVPVVVALAVLPAEPPLLAAVCFVVLGLVPEPLVPLAVDVSAALPGVLAPPQPNATKARPIDNHDPCVPFVT